MLSQYVFRALVVATLAGLSFAWGAAVVQYSEWPYELLKRFGDRPSAEQVLSQAGARRSKFKTFQPDVNVVFLGDSLTGQAEWSDMFPRFRVANRGMGGEDFSHMLVRLDEVLALSPEIVVLSGGINNAGRHSLGDTLGQYREIVTRLEARGVEVVLVTPIVCNCDRRSFLDALIPEIETFARQNGNRLVDLNPQLAPTGQLLARFTYDGVHLTGPAYREWQAALEPVLLERLPAGAFQTADRSASSTNPSSAR